MLKSCLIDKINEEYNELINMQEIIMDISDSKVNEILDYLQNSYFLNDVDKIESLLHTLYICCRVRPARRTEIFLVIKEIKPQIKKFYTDSELTHLIQSFSVDDDFIHFKNFMNMLLQEDYLVKNFNSQIFNIIASDDIEQFQNYLSNNNISVDNKLSIQLLGQNATYLSMSFLFNASKIAAFLRMNNAKIRLSDRSCAIAGGNYDFIHCAYDSFPDKPNEIELDIAIKFHRNNVATWIHENYQIEYTDQSVETSIKYYNSFMIKELKELRLFNPIQYYSLASRYYCYEIFIYFLTFCKKSKNAEEIQEALNKSFNEASKSGCYRIVNFILENDLVSHNINSIFHKSNKKTNPIILAAKRGNLKVFDVLLNFRNKNLIRLDLNWKTNLEMTPLHYAVKNQRIDMVMFLSSFEEVNLNDQCLIGWTPLHFAVDQEDAEIVRFFCSLNERVDKKIKDRFGETPIDLAKKNCLYEIEHILNVNS